jgi:hypothetical protein
MDIGKVASPGAWGSKGGGREARKAKGEANTVARVRQGTVVGKTERQGEAGTRALWLGTGKGVLR